MKKRNNSINVPEARQAMDRFKQQAASKVGVNLKQGCNGDLSSREAGSVGVTESSASGTRNPCSGCAGF